MSMLFTVASFAQTNYYYKGTGNLNSTANWGQNTDGTGTPPSNFTSNNQVFNVRNVTSVTNSGTWTVSGTGSKIVIGNGTNACNVTVPTGTNTIVGTVDVSANASLTLTNTTLPTLGTLNAASTVIYNGTATQTITAVTYGNLTYSGSSTGTFGGGCTINGDFSCTSGNVTFNNSGTARTFTINGDFTMSSTGSIEFGSSTASGTINLAGNLSKTNGAMTTTTASANEVINMTGSNVTLQSTSTGTIMKWVNINITNGSTCSFVGDFNMNGSAGTNGVLTVNSGGTLITGTANLLATNSTFTLSAGGTLQIGSTAGITSSGATGNIQASTRSYATGANYVYNGSASQATGNGLPATVNSLTINNSGAPGANIVSLAQNTAITTDLNITAGVLNIGTFTANRASAGGTLTVAGTLQLGSNTGGQTGSNFPANFSSVVLTGGTVEYTRAGTQTVYGGANYNNLSLFGSGAKTFGATTTINGNLAINSGVTATLGTFTHSANSITLAGNGQQSGSYGGTGSGATYILTTYFTAATGKINVSTGSCISGTWLGNVSTDWNTASNWCGAAVPTSSTDVVIPSGTAFAPTIASGTTAVCRDITINTGATLTLANSATSLLNVSGDFDNDGTLTQGASSKISFVGNVAQNIFGNSTTSFTNLTISNNTAAVSISVNINVSGTFSVGTGAIVTPAATTVINSSAAAGTISGTGTVQVTRITATADYSNQYKFTTNTLNSITVDYTGAGAQTINAFTYGSLSTSGSGTKTMGGTVVVNNTATVGAGTTLDENTRTMTIAGGGSLVVNGTLDFTSSTGLIQSGTSGTSTLTIGSTGTIRTIDPLGIGPVANASFVTQAGGAWSMSSIAGNGTVEYYINSATGVITDMDYNNLTITGTSFAKTWTPGSARTVNGTVTIAGNFTIAGSQTINVKGDWTKTAGTFTPNTGTINFNGSSAQNINGASTTGFYNLTINTSSASTTVTSSGNAFSVANNLTVTQGNLVLQSTDANYNITGDFTVAANGTVTHSVNWDVAGKQITLGGSLVVDGLWDYTVRSHVQMTGANKTIRTGPAPSSLSILTLATTSGTINASGLVTIDDNFWASFNTAGGTFATNGQNVIANAGLLNAGGTVNVNGGSLTIAGGLQMGSTATATLGGTVNLSSGTLTTDGIILGSSTNTVASTLTQTGGTLQVNGDVTINQPAANTTTNTWNIGAQSATVTGNISFAGTNTTATRVGKIIITTGSLNANGGISFSGTTAATKVIDMSTGGGTGILNLKGAISGTSGATLTAGTAGSTFNYADNSGSQTVNMFGAGAYNILAINTTGGSGATLGAAVTAANVTGNLSVQSGTLNNGAFAMTLASAKNFAVANGATFNLTGTSTMVTVSGGGVKTFGATSTVNYAGSAQAVTAESYGNLALSGSGNKTFAGATSIANNLAISGTAIALLPNGSTSSALTLTLGGVNQSTGSWGGTTSSATNKNATWFGNATTGIININTGCTSGTWLGIFSTDWNDAGNWCGGIPTSTTDVVITSAPANQPVIGIAGGTCRNITIGSGASLTITGSNNLTVSGDWTNNGGTFTPNNGTVNFNSTSTAQTIGGSVATQTFYNLAINKSGQSLAIGGSTALVNVSNVLTLTAGTLNTGANVVSVTNNAASAVAATSGYVIGNLRRSISTTPATYTFAVGTASGTSSASFAFTALSSGGTLMVTSNDGAGTNYPSNLHATKKLARNWTVINGGLTGVSGSATFSYLAGDLAGGASATALKAYVYSGTASYATSTGTTGSSFTFNGLASFGEFGAGECLGTLAATFTKTMASSCGGGADGSITASASGGASPYSYSWTSTPSGFTATTAAITGLSPKDYTIVVTDITGCTATIPDITIWQALAPTITFTGGGSSACGNTGYVTMYASNGVAPFTYSLDGVTYQASNAFTNLAAGTYTGYVKDLRGCITTKPNIVVNAAAAMVVTAYTRPASSCANNGSIELYRTGGTGPYTYSLNGTTYQGSNVFTNLTGNTTYTGYVKDSKGCVATLANITVAKATAVSVTQKHTNASACGNDGTITLTGAGGVPPYTYSKTGAAGPYQSSNVFTAVAAGSYTCWVQDSKGCKALVAVTIGTTGAMNLTATATVSGACNSSGTVKLTVTGGTSPYTYSLNDITYQSINTFSSVAAGTYTGWVKDATGCKKSLSGIVVGSATALTTTESHTNSSVCVNDGSIQLRPSGGTQPYTYSLDDITYQSGAHLSNLAAGSYTGWVKDARGCKASVAVTIGTNVINVTSYASAASSCMASNGSIQLFMTGGVNPYTYSLDGVTFQSSNVFTGLTPGTYDGYVKDSKGCLGVALNIEVGPSGCSRTSAVTRSRQAAATGNTKVSGNQDMYVQVYPNPSQSAFKVIVNTAGKDKITLTVSDVMGKIVYQTTQSDSRNISFGDNLKPGIYFAELVEGDKRRIIKLIKE